MRQSTPSGAASSGSSERTKRRATGTIAAALAACAALACGSEVRLPSGGQAGSTSNGSSSSGAGGAGTSSGVGSASAASSGSGGAGGGAGGLPTFGDVLDPAEVYLSGTLQEGACYLGALAHWSTPNLAATGFDCEYDPGSAVIRTSDGRLLYTTAFGSSLHQFTCDECPFGPGSTYSNDPMANDPVLPTPCVGDPWSLAFLVSPWGAVIQTCDDKTWFDEAGNTVYADADPLVHLGYSQLALTTQRVVDLETHQAVDIVGLPDGDILTARAFSPDAFWVVLMGWQDREERWKIGADGTATLEGTYPPVPPAVAFAVPYSGKLEATGALVQVGIPLQGSDDVIVRRTLQGSSEVVYDEATNPLVRVDASTLVTGP